MCFCKEIILISSHFSWQMARVVGGALHVRMFLHMFLITILVSVVSFFAYTGVSFTLLIVPQFPALERQCAGHVLEVTNKTSELQEFVRHHMHVVCHTARVTGLCVLGRLFWRWAFSSCPPGLLDISLDRSLSWNYWIIIINSIKIIQSHWLEDENQTLWYSIHVPPWLGLCWPL